MVRDDLFLQKDLQTIRDGLEQAEWTDPVWAHAVLDISSEFALDEGHVKTQERNNSQDDRDGSQDGPKSGPFLYQFVDQRF